MGTSDTRAKSRYLGPLPDGLWEILEYAWSHGISVQSDYARAAAPEVALAASMGWLSNIDTTGRGFTRRWRITSSGLYALTHKELFPS